MGYSVVLGMFFSRRTSTFEEFRRLVSIMTETELKRMRVRLSHRDVHLDAKRRMIDKRIAITHGFKGA